MSDTDFDREPKPAALELTAEFTGDEGVVQLDMWDDKVRVTNVHGCVLLTLDDLETISEHMKRFAVALHAVRGTQP